MTVQLPPSHATSHSGPASPDAAIELERLVKVYKTTRAVDDISFSIARGSVTG
ncbi:MAG: ABC transporter ATP-binding protein, partial [Afipia sp.]